MLVLDRPATGTLIGCAYGRNSSDKDASIERQLRGARERATPFGISIPNHLVFSDGVGASLRTDPRKRRDQWAEVLDLIRARAFDVLVVWEMSRADRSPDRGAALVVLCRTLGVRILTTSGSGRLWDPRDTSDFESLLQAVTRSAIETEVLGDRTKEGISSMIARGAPTGRSLFGYDRVFEGEGKERVCVGQGPNDDAAAVREVFARVAKGHTLTGVVEWLNREGYKTLSTQRRERQEAMKVKPAKLAKPAPWSTAHVRDMVRNRSYLGERPTGDGPANWPELVDASLFRDANAVLDGRRPTSRPAAAKSLLTGVAVCECGAPVRATTRKGQRLYACADKGCVAIDLTEMDRLVTDVVFGLVSKPEVHAKLRRADETLAAEVEAAETELARLEADLDAARREWLANRLSLAAYQAKEQVMLPKIDRTRKAAQAAKIHPALRELVGEDLEGDVRERWAKMTPESRRDAVRALMTITVHRVGRGRRSVPAEQRVTLDPRE